MKLIQTQKEIKELAAGCEIEKERGRNQPSQMVILASFSSLETGHSRDWLYRWAAEKDNLVLLTQRGPPGSLSRLLYEQWVHAVDAHQNTVKLPLSEPISLEFDTTFQVRNNNNDKAY